MFFNTILSSFLYLLFFLDFLLFSVYYYLVGGVYLKKDKFVPAIPLDSSAVVPCRFFELHESLTVFDPPLHLRRVNKGSVCPGQLSLFGGDSDARHYLP